MISVIGAVIIQGYIMPLSWKCVMHFEHIPLTPFLSLPLPLLFSLELLLSPNSFAFMPTM